MKKLLLVTNLVTLIALCFFIWEHQHPKKCPPSPPISCYDAGSMKMEGLYTDFVKMLISNYRRQQWTTYRNTTKFCDSRAVWFSLNKLKSFIQQMEASACASCIGERRTTLGIHFYFGTYPRANEWHRYGLDTIQGMDIRQAGQHTLVLIPTYYNSALHTDIDFDPSQMNANPCRPKRIAEIFPRSDSSHTPALARIMSAVPGETHLDMENHGTTWPLSYDGRFDPPFTNQNPPVQDGPNVDCSGATVGTTGADELHHCPPPY